MKNHSTKVLGRGKATRWHDHDCYLVIEWSRDGFEEIDYILRRNTPGVQPGDECEVVYVTEGRNGFIHVRPVQESKA